MSAAVAGLLAGAAVGTLGTTLPEKVRVSIGVLGAMMLALGSLTTRIPLPQLNRETEQRLLHEGPLRWALINGALLGFGFTSRIGFWTWYFVPLTCFTSGSVLGGALVWGVYGLVRMLVAVVAAMWMRRRSDLMIFVADAMLGARSLARRSTNVTAFALAAILLFRLGP